MNCLRGSSVPGSSSSSKSDKENASGSTPRVPMVPCNGEEQIALRYVRVRNETCQIMEGAC